MSAIWGPQSALDLYLQEEGITTLLMSGVNADQVNENPTYLLHYIPSRAVLTTSDCSAYWAH